LRSLGASTMNLPPDRWTNYRTPSHCPLQGPPLEDSSRLTRSDIACIAVAIMSLGIAAWIIFA